MVARTPAYPLKPPVTPWSAGLCARYFDRQTRKLQEKCSIRDNSLPNARIRVDRAQAVVLEGPYLSQLTSTFALNPVPTPANQEPHAGVGRGEGLASTDTRQFP